MTTTLNASTAGAGGFIATSDNSGSLALQTAGTTAVTIDTSQRVGVGTTSPSTQLHAKGSGSGTFGAYQDPVIVEGNTFTYLQLKGNTGGGGVAGIIFNRNGSTGYLQTLDNAGNMKFGYLATMNEAGITNAKDSATPSLYLDSSGNLLVGTTSLGSAERVSISYNGAVQRGMEMNNTNAGTQDVIYFRTTGTNVGRINTSTTATSYITSSDYRLKEDINPMTNALAKVSALKPVTYKWKLNGSDGQGFIAHELQEIVPDCVHGSKDEIDADGKPVYQGIDTSFLVATLTAAIQELKAINDTQAETINALTARVVALESRGTV